MRGILATGVIALGLLWSAAAAAGTSDDGTDDNESVQSIERTISANANFTDSVAIGVPVQLWSAHTSSQGIPYVDYSWPHSAKVRDFSRVVPLGPQAGDVIAWVDGLPVALKRQDGRGTLLFLGSPLGPALWAGDAEARRWLFDCLGEAGGCAEPAIS